MKLTIDSSALSDAVMFAARAVNPKNAVPVLQGIRLIAKSGELTITGFDNETSNTITVAADTEVDGAALLPAAILGSILKALPNNKPLALEVDARANIKCGKARFSTPAMPLDQYPPLPGLPELLGTVDGHLMARAVEQVEFAVAREDALRELCGIKVEATSDTLSFLATDRYRMAFADIPWTPAPGFVDSEFLIKANVLASVTRGAAGEMRLMLSDHIAGFVSGRRTTTATLMAGNYPKVRGIFPSPDQETAFCTVPTAELLASVNRAAVVIEGKHPVRLAFSGAEVLVDAGAGDSSTGEEAVDATLDGEDRTVSINPQFLGDALRAISTENTIFGFRANPGAPVSIQEQAESGELSTQSRQLVMPIKALS